MAKHTQWASETNSNYEIQRPGGLSHCLVWHQGEPVEGGGGRDMVFPFRKISLVTVLKDVSEGVG